MALKTPEELAASTLELERLRSEVQAERDLLDKLSADEAIALQEPWLNSPLRVELLKTYHRLQKLPAKQALLTALDELSELERTVDPKPQPGKPVLFRPMHSVRTPTLDAFGIDLTAKAADGKLSPAIGREAEIERMAIVLNKRQKNNPVLIGEPGVGKTAIVEGLAQRIVEGDVPKGLQGKRVISIDLSALVAGTKYRGEFEERLTKLLAEIKDNPDVIPFIDELHTAVNAGEAEGAQSAGESLKPALARGELNLIGATTLKEYRHIEKNGALERRFQPITVDEPSIEVTLEILRGIKAGFENHTEERVEIPEAFLTEAVQLGQRYLTERRFPDKAIDIMDEAASEARLDGRTELTPEDARRVVAKWKGIPIEKIGTGSMGKLKTLKSTLQSKIVGQEIAVTETAAEIRRAFVRRIASKKGQNQPINLAYLGPTGVGKTELARAIAEEFFDDPNAMTRIDMSEYMEKINVSRLIGASPGYVGYEEGGTLTEAVRRRPYQVLLFDEIEKAHPDALNLFLQLLDAGRLTDGQGHQVDFRNTIVLMTSNLIQGPLSNRPPAKVGLRAEPESKLALSQDQLARRALVHEHGLRPEFVNRVAKFVVFNPLDRPAMRAIVALELSKVIRGYKRYTIEVSEAAREELALQGHDPQFGARPLKRLIAREIESRITDAIVDGALTPNGHIQIDLVDGKFEHSVVPASAAATSPLAADWKGLDRLAKRSKSRRVARADGFKSPGKAQVANARRR